VLPLVDASFISWTKHYRPDENSNNTAISYYLKGEIVCALLDLQLRRATNDAKSLDDLLRLLWSRYGDESGVPEGGVEAAAEELGGPGLRDFFRDALRGTGELSYDVFSHVGLEVKFRPRESNSDKGGTAPRKSANKVEGWVGITVRVTLFRRDRLLELPVTVAAKPADGVYLQRVEGATEAQKAAYQAWLGAPWNELDSLNAVAPKV
jgi:predicted metalloprotease with PDZ domain